MEGAPWGIFVFLAVLITLCMTGIFAFAGFAWPTENLLPDSYYKIKNAQILKRICSFLQLDLFRKFLLATFWRKQQMQKDYFDGTAVGLKALDRNSRKSEFGHLIPFVLLAVLCMYTLLFNWWVFSGTVMLINIFFNFYPILLQRHHRMRISILRRRFGG